VLWALEDELTKRGIEIPFPQRDVRVRSGTLNVSMESADDDARAQRPEEGLSGSPSAQAARA
jgi:small-conductance mechanosensitive channel